MAKRIKLAAVVILYEPEHTFLDNIKSYMSVLDKLWIIDNSENNLKNIRQFFDSASLDKIQIVQDGKNEGIGKRINYAVNASLNAGYQWLLTMDQDSSFTQSNLKKYLEVLSSLTNINKKIVAIGVNYDYEEKEPSENISLKEDMNIITSGTCINLNEVGNVGLMNEDLFIDEVDSEYSYRAISKGRQILICNGIYIKHALGKRVIGRSVATGKKTFRSLHTPLRIYYMTRNYFWVRKKYKSFFPEVFKKRNIQMLHIIKNNLLYNKQRLNVLRMIFRGYLDFKKNKLGKIQELHI